MKMKKILQLLLLMLLTLPLAAQHHNNDGHHSTEDMLVMPYRGQRIPAQSEAFCMSSLTVLPYGGKELTIDVFFNQGIDPRTFKSQNIVIDDKTIPENSSITFNREGTQARIKISGNVHIPFSIIIRNVLSYNGQQMGDVKLEQIDDGDTWRYSEDKNQWKKY